MKVCLVTAFPPSQQLSGSGYQLARDLLRDPNTDVTILAERVRQPAPEPPDLRVVRCWNEHSAWNIVRVFKELRHQRPDVVWFDVSFPRFFEKPLARLLEVLIPQVCRVFGYAWPILIL